MNFLATAEQVKALVKGHFEHEDEKFKKQCYKSPRTRQRMDMKHMPEN